MFVAINKYVRVLDAVQAVLAAAVDTDAKDKYDSQLKRLRFGRGGATKSVQTRDILLPSVRNTFLMANFKEVGQADAR